MGNYHLVADPSPLRARETAALLEGALPVFSVRDGQEALALVARRGPPEVLVTDLSLPKLDGFALIRTLRQRDGGERTRVVVLSAFQEMREAAERLQRELDIVAVISTHGTTERLARALRSASPSGPPEWRRERPGTPALLPQQTPAQAIPRGASAPTPSDAPRAPFGRMDGRDEAPRLRNVPIPHLAPPLARGAGTPACDDPKLEAMVRRVARKFGVPMAVVSLVFEGRLWFKAKVGMPAEAREIPLDVTFCRHVLMGGEPMVVPDAQEHPTFRTNRLVAGGHVRGYAGAPLVGSDGEIWGAVCIVDPTKPLDLTASELAELALIAEEIMREIEAESEPVSHELGHASSARISVRSMVAAHAAGVRRG